MTNKRTTSLLRQAKFSYAAGCTLLAIYALFVAYRAFYGLSLNAMMIFALSLLAVVVVTTRKRYFAAKATASQVDAS